MKFLDNIELASKLVLKEDKELFKELAKEQPKPLSAYKHMMLVSAKKGDVVSYYESDVKQALALIVQDIDTKILRASCRVLMKEILKERMGESLCTNGEIAVANAKVSYGDVPKAEGSSPSLSANSQEKTGEAK